LKTSSGSIAIMTLKMEAIYTTVNTQSIANLLMCGHVLMLMGSFTIRNIIHIFINKTLVIIDRTIHVNVLSHLIPSFVTFNAPGGYREDKLKYVSGLQAIEQISPSFISDQRGLQ
jgi:hypothetical protein